MNLVHIAFRIAPIVLVAALATGCAASAAAPAREPRSSVLSEPRLEQSRVATLASTPAYGGATPRTERLRQ